MRRCSAVVLAFGLALASACANERAGSGVRFVSVGAGGNEIALHTNAPRLAAASKELVSLVGHDVTFELDAELLPEHAAHLEESLADAVETIVRVLSRIKRESPSDFAHTAALLRTVRTRHDAAVREVTGTLEPSDHALTFRVPQGSYAFTTEKIVSDAVHAR
jgi:hypothetical protein